LGIQQIATVYALTRRSQRRKHAIDLWSVRQTGLYQGRVIVPWPGARARTWQDA